MSKKTPPYVVRGTPVMSKKFREEYESALSEEDLRLRKFLIDQNRGAQNIAPGSPLYDRVMGTNLSQPHSVSPQPLPAVEPLLKLIMRQAFYFLCLMLAVAVGWAVLS